MRRVLTLMAALVALAAGGARAHAAGEASAPTARPFHTVLQDDELALYSPRLLEPFVRTLRRLGVDELRISAEWKLEAPDPDSHRAPTGFAAADPRAYDGSVAMRQLDAAVRAAAGQGIGVIIDPSFSAPLWATRNTAPTRVAPTDPWFNRDIDVEQLVAWETMLARRYDGHYVPSGARAPLPRVGTFTLWNEPNEAGFLEPQWVDGIAASADWYRRVVELAYPAITEASPGVRVLIGETSSVGSDQQAGSGGVPPLDFIRRLACVDAALEPITTGACADFHEIPGDGYSQHPYEREAPPWIPSAPAHSGDAQMGDLGGLQALLDRLVAMHRFAPGLADLWLTEQGYGSNAQIHQEPWTETEQADLDADAEDLAWSDPLIRSFSQFLLRDSLTTQTLRLRARNDDPNAWIGGTWTTGLEREDGAPKPALAMFRSPVAARYTTVAPLDAWLGSSPPGAPTVPIEVWGRARPLRSPALVAVQVSDDGLGDWRSAGTAVTDSDGVFQLAVAVSALGQTRVRFRWPAPSGARWITSPANIAEAMTP